MAELAEELKRSNKELEAFSYSVSHDLRAPFRHIVGFAQLLRERQSGLDAKSLHYLEMIGDSALAAGKLVDDLLHFSQLGRTSVSKQKVDMDKLVAEVRQGMAPELRDRNIEWQVDKLPIAFGDQSLLRQVWHNLIDNAVKYTRPRNPAIISISGRIEGKNAIYRIVDNGVGFDMNYHSKLFGVFQRLQRVEDFEGTGLALRWFDAYWKDIREASLPRARSTRELPSHSRCLSEAKEPCLPELRPILLVEDNPRDLELTLTALEKCQLANEVIVARDGAEALAFLHAEDQHADRAPGDPAVVLLDLKLPKVDGLEVLAKVKGNERLRHIPIVMLTSSREEQDLVRSYELGVNAFVVKPVEFNQFFKAIQDLGVFWALLNEPPPRLR